MCLRLTSPQFQYTNKADQQRNPRGYIVSATEPAVSVEEDAPSYFQYQMKYPLKSTKLMLNKLDDLVARTPDGQEGFYVVQIKEGLDTT
jgi:hypothetical protein